jgi:hypothetical protein
MDFRVSGFSASECCVTFLCCFLCYTVRIENKTRKNKACRTGQIPQGSQIFKTLKRNKTLSEEKIMEMTLSRKVLNIAGILDYIAGGFTFLLGAVIAGAGVLAMNNPEFAQDMPTDLGVFTVLIIGIALAAGALLTMIYAHLERAAAKNPAKIMPVWVLSILSVLLNIGNLIHNLMMHVAIAEMGSCFTGLAISILMLVIAKNIKKEAGR